MHGALSAVTRGDVSLPLFLTLPHALPLAPGPGEAAAGGAALGAAGAALRAAHAEELQCLQDELRRLQEDMACDAQVQQLAQLERHSCLGPEVEELK